MSARSKTKLVLAVLATPMFISGAQAATYNWNNTGIDFNAAASWNTLPPINQVAVFASAAGTQPNLSANFSALGLSFSSNSLIGYDITATSPFSLTLTAAATNVAINGSNTKGINTIDAPLVLGAAANAVQTIIQAAGGTLVVNGVISSPKSVVLNISKTTAGTTGGVVTLAGANTYSGGTTLDGFTTLNINNGGTDGTSSAIGTGGFTWNSGGIIDNTSGSGVILSTNNDVTLIGVSTWAFTGSDDLDFGLGTATVNANVTLANKSQSGKTLTFGSLVNNKSSSGITLTVNGASNAPVVFGGFTLRNMGSTPLTHTVKGTGSVKFTGVISDGNGVKNSLTYCGSGLLQLGGDNTYTGSTIVQSGTVQLDGTTTGQDNFTVMTGADATVAPTLIGTGAIGLASGKSFTLSGGVNSKSVLYLATVNPGDVSTTSATFRIGTDSTNQAFFDDNSVLAIDINDDATDKLAITGDLLLRGTSTNLRLNAIGEQTLGRYVFSTYTGSLTGTFATVIYNGGNLPENLSIDYSNREIALVGLPEPVGMSFLIGSAGAGLLIRRRTRQA